MARKVTFTFDEKLVRKGLIVLGIVAVLAILYELVLPGMLAGRYNGRSKSAFESLQPKVASAYQTFEYSTYSTNLGAGSHKIEDPKARRQADDNAINTEQGQLDLSKKAVEDARKTLDKDGRQLSSFARLPFLGWNSEYRKAKEKADKAKEYVDRTKAYLNEYDLVIKYFLSENDLSRESQAVYYNEYEPLFQQLSPNDLPGAATKVRPPLEKYFAILEKGKAIQAPESVTELDQWTDRKADEQVRDLRDFLDSLSRNDVNRVISIVNKGSDDSAADQEDNEYQALTTKFHQQSKLRGLINEVKQRESELRGRL